MIAVNFSYQAASGFGWLAVIILPVMVMSAIVAVRRLPWRVLAIGVAVVLALSGAAYRSYALPPAPTVDAPTLYLHSTPERSVCLAEGDDAEAIKDCAGCCARWGDWAWMMCQPCSC